MNKIPLEIQEGIEVNGHIYPPGTLQKLAEQINTKRIPIVLRSLAQITQDPGGVNLRDIEGHIGNASVVDGAIYADAVGCRAVWMKAMRDAGIPIAFTTLCEAEVTDSGEVKLNTLRLKCVSLVVTDSAIPAASADTKPIHNED